VKYKPFSRRSGGSAQHAVPEGAHFNGTDFAAGRRLRAWLKRTEGDPIDREAGRDLLRRLKAYRASAWDSAMAHEACIAQA
jgi:hypothetical protein